MKKIKILIIIILIILSFILVLVLKKNTNYDFKNNNYENGNLPLENNYNLIEIKSVSKYKTINKIIDLTSDYVKSNNTQALKSVLIKEYIDNDGLSILNTNSEYIINKVYLCNAKLSIDTYFVYGDIINKEDEKRENCNFIINLDESNSTFELAPLGSVYNKYINYEELKIKEDITNEIKDIQENNYNKAVIVNGLSEKEIMGYYYEQFSLNLLYNKEKAYNLLDKEYREKRFKKYENFVEYINNNKDCIEKSLIIKYKIEEFDNYKEYSIIDNFNNMYIFLEKEPMEYTVLLDEYTINDRIIFNQYKNSDKKGKAQMNLEKFMHMINKKDYETAYNVLDEKFKEKYFNNINQFIEYIKNNLFEYNEFNYEEMTEKDTDTIKIKTIINDKSYNSNNKKIKRFNIKLLENYGFNISFDI